MATRKEDLPDVLARFFGARELVRRAALVVRRTVGPALSLDELESFGHEALLLAARRYNPALGVPFERWAWRGIQHRMIDGARAARRWSAELRGRLRVALAVADAADSELREYVSVAGAAPEWSDARCTRALDVLVASATIAAISSPQAADEPEDARPSPEQRAAEAQLVRVLHDALAELPERERLLIVRHYFEGMTIEEAGRSVDLSDSWASRVHASTLETLGRALKRRGIASEHTRDPFTDGRRATTFRRP